jgi:hypothetical protein
VLAEAGAYALAIVLVLWPGIVHARTQLLGRSDDARYYCWLGWRIGRALASGHVLPAQLADAVSPYGLDVRLLDGYLPSYVCGLWNLLVGPTLAYNLTFVAGAVLNVLAARALARRLSTKPLVHVITAVAFLTAPPIALNVQVGLLPLFWAFSVPLLLADAIDVASGDRPVRPVRLTVLLVVAFLCSIYFLVFGGLVYGIVVGVAALRTRRRRIPVRTAAAVVATLALLSPFVVARVRYERDEAHRGGETELLADSRLYSADALSILARPTRATIPLPRPAPVDRAVFRLADPTHVLEATIFPGLVLLAGFALFCASPHALRLPLGAAALATWLLALGPSLKYGGRFVWSSDEPVGFLPYWVLLKIPALGALRAPLRAGYVLAAVLAAGTAVAGDRLAGRRRDVAVVGLGATALLATNLLVPLPTSTLGTTRASEQALREVDRVAARGDTVLRVPADCDPAFVSLQTLHRSPVVGCAGSFAANPWTELERFATHPSVTKLRCDREQYGRIATGPGPGDPFGPLDVVSLRRDFGVRFVVVDRPAAHLGCEGVRAALPVLASRRVLGADDRWEIIDLAPPNGQ